MNTTLRRLSAVVMVMFLALMVSTTYTQFFRAERLNADGRNVRSIFREFNVDRGPIVVAGQPIVESVPVDTPFGFQRVFSGGDADKAQMYAPVTGFFSLVNGSTGVESAENAFLNGQADALWVDRLQNMLTGRKAQGSSVELTIDPAIQQAAWDALGGQRGSIVAVDPKTGAILAMVSKPSFDPNALAVHSTGEAGQAYQDLLNADGDPLINRAIGALYPPGSTFKLVGAAAALESGDYQGDTQISAPHRFTLPGTRTELPNFGDEVCSPTDMMSIHDAMVMSCNTAFASLAVDLGADAMRDQAAKFGFDDVFRVPMRSAVSAFPSAGDAFTPDRLALAGIGQGDVTSTPLQMAMVSAAIANHGTLMQPYLVQTIRDPELEVVQQTQPAKVRDAVSPATASALTQMMVDTVERGTGTAARISGVQVAGKTGTAQTAQGVAPHAWFTAFAPAQDPQIAVAVIVEHGGDATSEATGGRVAAPMARAVIEAALSR
ncbi:peptidoglycan D,D-transpeptidase FtsI family protein [Xylanimonas ulmi]|uniref:Cell elongation-specific peptidoglycan D,D-transpeptidase n=1 Tax=Xylanimonas ulmi TaxID=228973 RepID=A0A4Q7M7N6_9MICO|nr:penicillin-binding transpeptidase domain-containing protein [Xylanibacterium ulmi]RZS62672.1 cell elongation-specific peptidoglycan D,D-transpeptidase [Xylanibacterium ulmi]